MICSYEGRCSGSRRSATKKVWSPSFLPTGQPHGFLVSPCLSVDDIRVKSRVHLVVQQRIFNHMTAGVTSASPGTAGLGNINFSVATQKIPGTSMSSRAQGLNLNAHSVPILCDLQPPITASTDTLLSSVLRSLISRLPSSTQSQALLCLPDWRTPK